MGWCGREKMKESYVTGRRSKEGRMSMGNGEGGRKKDKESQGYGKQCVCEPVV